MELRLARGLHFWVSKDASVGLVYEIFMTIRWPVYTTSAAAAAADTAAGAVVLLWRIKYNLIRRFRCIEP